MTPQARAARRWLVAGLLLLLPLTLWLLLAPVPAARGKPPAAPLPAGYTPEQQRAHDLALADARVQAALAGHRAEVFGVRAVGGQYPAGSEACAAADCRQVEIYLFDTDTTVLALVDLDAEVVRAVLEQPGVQPGANQRVTDLAAEIARTSPAVIAEAGYTPARAQLTPMNGGGECPPAHLCLAMTLPDDGSLIWIVVDVTAEQVVAVSRLPGPADAGELSALTTAVATCPAAGSVERYGWRLDYETTGTDGLRVAQVTHYGVPVLTSAKLAQWHVDYGAFGFQDVTGCGGGGGGYLIYPYGETTILPVTTTDGVPGFEVAQDFRMSNWGGVCNYRYSQHFQFFADGRFRAAAAAYGKGCYADSVYRPLLRLDVAVGGDAGDSLQQWDGADWVTATTEAYFSQLPPYTSAEAKWRVSDAGGRAYTIEPGQGQFADGGTGDNAYLYGVVHHAAEGDTDLGVIGSCCLDNQNQGPHNYINGEPLTNTNVVLWYVPQQVTAAADPYYCWTVGAGANPQTYPCRAGPMFVPEFAAGLWHDAPALLGAPVHFTSTLRPGASYQWDFGDGAGTALTATAAYTYAAPGWYTVTVTISDTLVSGVYTDTVFVGAPPEAGFGASPPVPLHPTFTFTDTSTGTGPLSYLWAFGDGLTSTLPSPQHTYVISGPVTVTLTVSNPLGNDTAAVQIQVPPLYRVWFPRVIED